MREGKGGGGRGKGGNKDGCRGIYWMRDKCVDRIEGLEAWKEKGSETEGYIEGCDKKK